MMTRIKKLIYPIVMLLVLLVSLEHAIASDSFVVKNIQFKGLQHLSPATVLSYVPFKKGDTFTSAKGIKIVTRLYQTKFFNNIELSKAGDTLVITVQERPVISLLAFSGNKAITNQQLKDVLQNAGIQEGKFFDSAQLKAIQEGLKAQYTQLGYSRAAIKVSTQQAKTNQIVINILITEGPLAKVKNITFKGNKKFSSRLLRGQIKLSKTNLFSFITHNDRYSQDSLSQATTALHNFYLDQGYLNFKVLSENVSITPDHQSVYITLTLHEGMPFRIDQIKLSGQLLDLEKEVRKLIKIKPGHTFSKKKVIETNQKIAELFSNYGYAFPQIETKPSIHQKQHTVLLTWIIHPGKRIYVRHINIKGNKHTTDSALRFRLLQLEGSLYSSYKIAESKRRLANLPYLSDIKIQNQPVAGKKNELDLDVNVTETIAGKASLQGGYSDTSGFVYGASITDPNFLGTGKQTGIGIERSSSQDTYYFNYNNPFYTVNGVSRGFSVYYNHLTPEKVDITSYAISGLGGSLNYGIPISNYSRFLMSFGYNNLHVSTSDSTDPSIIEFVNQYGDHYQQFSISPSWVYSTYDRAIFPTKGMRQTIGSEISVPITSSSLSYYKLNYNVSYYYPIMRRDWILHLHTTLGYGDGYGDTHTLPFFKHYYAGGIDTMPGFKANTLGPKDINGNGLGGNILTLGGADLIFPNHISQTLRTALVFNAGNIYENKLELDDLRYSAGIKISWFSPLGAVIEISISEPLNAKSGDERQVFGFSFGASI
jgi:outer membrane protein insertion porin family